MSKQNLRGVKKVIMVNVIEGDGKEIPFREVHYIFDLAEHDGTWGGCIGKIDPLDTGLPADEQKSVLRQSL